jgi:hypothetical protein
MILIAMKDRRRGARRIGVVAMIVRGGGVRAPARRADGPAAGTSHIRRGFRVGSANEVVATDFRTDPPTLIAERGDSVSLMWLEPAGSGAKDRGRNESLWEHQSTAVVVWGDGAREMRCTTVD